MTLKKTKYAAILAIIAASVTILTAFIDLLSFINMESFVQQIYLTFAEFDEMFEGGQSFLEILASSFSTTQETIIQIVVVISIVQTILLFAVSIAILILSIFALKASSLIISAYRKKKGIIIADCVLCMFTVVFLSASLSILLIIAFIFFIIDLVQTKKFANFMNPGVDMKEYGSSYDAIFVKDEPVVEEKVVEEEKTPLSDEEILRNEQEYQKRKKRLEETYELLAKLEKSYKNGELSEEDYKRMKSQIIENGLG